MRSALCCCYRCVEGCRKRGDLSFEEYDAWLQVLSDALQDEGIKPVRTFLRYAEPLATPSNPAPGHLLLDIAPEDFEVPDGPSCWKPLEMDQSYDVLDGNLRLRIAGTDYPAVLAWDADRLEFKLRSADVSNLDYRESQGDRLELLDFINRNQAMRIVTLDCATVYAHGDFFEPIRPHRDRSRFRLLDVLVGVDALEGVSSEKGAATLFDDWDAASVFGFISALSPSSDADAPDEMKVLFPNLDFLLCTDLGTEVADFIACEPGRIAMIHAKAKNVRNPSKRSASALQEVVAQAIKNLLYLQPLSDEAPPQGTWTSKWTRKDSEDWTVTRLRHGVQITAADMWLHAREQITSPGADREVWLVLGNALSKGSLEDEADKDKPAAETIQIYALLQTAWSAASQVGARLRVFCSP